MEEVKEKQWLYIKMPDQKEETNAEVWKNAFHRLTNSGRQNWLQID